MHIQKSEKLIKGCFFLYKHRYLRIKLGNPFCKFLRIKGFLSVDIDVSELQVNQCSSPRSKEPLSANKYYNEIFSQIEIFHESNKCHPHSMLVSIDNFIYIYRCHNLFQMYCKIEFCIHFHTFSFAISHSFHLSLCVYVSFFVPSFDNRKFNTVRISTAIWKKYRLDTR